MSERPDQSRLGDVGRTAWGVARIRARESGRPDRLFDDPFASLFVPGATVAHDADAHDARTASDPRRRAIAFQVVIRTRFYDDALLAAVDAGCRQVVLVAAGLDARAFRLSWPPGLTLFELDQPDVLTRKDDVLAGAGAQARCPRKTVGIDLREDWGAALVASGFDAGLPTAWLAEGLLVYLDDDSAARLLETVTGLSATGSRLAFEKRNPDAAAPDALAGLWLGGLAADPVGWLDSRGWASEVHGLADVAASYGRPMGRESQSGFLTATRLA
jgi:methyltransferase (TIGR00027 family)